MAKTKISEFSPTPANNTDIDNINIAEGCAPSGINDAIRELMAQLKDFQAGTAGDSFNGPIGSTTAVTGAFTNVTASGTLGVTGVATLGNGAVLGTPASVTLTNGTGLPIATGVSGLGTGVATALAVNVGSAGAPVLFNGALGTPSSGTVTNLTGTASININGTVGATTPTTGAFTTLTTSNTVTLNGGTANGVSYLDASKVLTTGSAMTFDGANLNVSGKYGVTGNGNTPTSTALEIGTNGAGSRWLYNVPTGGEHNFTVNGAVASWVNATSSGWLISGAEAMRLTSGNLGIGTSSPASKLVVSASGAAGFEVNPDGVGSAPALVAYNRSTSAYIQLTSLALQHVWQNSGTETMRLDTSGNLGIGTSSPSASAILDAQSTTKGVRMPNMTTTQKNAIASPAAGLMVFDTTLSKLCVYSGAAWETITSI